MISRRRIRLVIALLLPLMVLRALLPAGFMPEVGKDSLRIVMCSEGLYPTQIGDPSTGGDPGQSHDSSGCAFAKAAVNAPPPAASPAIIAMGVDVGASSPIVTPRFTTSILRVQSARGPPSLFL